MGCSASEIFYKVNKLFVFFMVCFYQFYMNGVKNSFIPLVDSGISVYIWSKSRFFSVVVYSCKGFDEEEAVAFARDFFEVTDAPVSMSF